MAQRAWPQEYLNRQPIVQGIEQPVAIQQAPAPAPVYYIVQQPDNTWIIVAVVGAIIIGAISIVALVAIFKS